MYQISWRNCIKYATTTNKKQTTTPNTYVTEYKFISLHYYSILYALDTKSCGALTRIKRFAWFLFVSVLYNKTSHIKCEWIIISEKKNDQNERHINDNHSIVIEVYDVSRWSTILIKRTFFSASTEAHNHNSRQCSVVCRLKFHYNRT